MLFYGVRSPSACSNGLDASQLVLCAFLGWCGLVLRLVPGALATTRTESVRKHAFLFFLITSVLLICEVSTKTGIGQVVISKMEITTQHGAIEGKTQTRETQFYNLDAIISVGYRVNSIRATHFRIWATSVLKEYMIKGFAMDDERLKQAKTAFGKDYFRELLERVRSIRASERRIWQQITDIFAECSIDYDKTAQVTKDFYATVQN